MKPLDQWTLEEKIGQMFIITVEGEEVTPELENMIHSYHIGGVILFQRNMVDLKKVIRLIRQLQEIANTNQRPPLWISIDQEGGGISYLWDQINVSPGNMLLGSTNNVDYAYEASHIMGEQLKQIGFNMNFSPVLDINSNPKNPVIGARSFGDSKELVASFGQYTVKGFTDAGILSVGKHFPGHGDTQLDSHISLPIIDKSLDELENLELYPFIHCIKHGLQAIMTAHIVFPKIEPALPATLSPYFLKKLLRERYRFGGLIITDSLEMKAISTFFGRERGAVLAVKAGADLVLACGQDYATQQKMIQAVIDAVNEQDIKKSTVEEAVSKLIEFKHKWIIENTSIHKSPDSIITFCKQSRFYNKMIEISLQGIALIVNEGGLIPLSHDQDPVLIISQETYNDENYMGDRKSIIKEVFHEARYHHLTLFQANPRVNDTKKVLKIIQKNQVVMVCINERRELNPAWNQLIQEIRHKTLNIIIVSLWNPQIIHQLPKEVNTYIATYSNTPHVIKALKELVEGRSTFKGKYNTIQY